MYYFNLLCLLQRFQGTEEQSVLTLTPSVKSLYLIDYMWDVVERNPKDINNDLTTGNILGCENILNLGNSSLKSLCIRGVHSRTAIILATMSFFCQRPRQDSP